MTTDDRKFLLMLCVIMLFCIGVGLHGIMNRKKINKVSDYYMSVNFLLGGVLLIPCILMSAIYFGLKAKNTTLFNENTLYLILLFWLGLAELTIGLHGLLNKKKINNPAFDRFSEASVITFVLVVIGIVVWVWLWGWPWDPHTLFEWQKGIRTVSF